jgi:hypothetical protein
MFLPFKFHKMHKLTIFPQEMGHVRTISIIRYAHIYFYRFQCYCCIRRQTDRQDRTNSLSPLHTCEVIKGWYCYNRSCPQLDIQPYSSIWCTSLSHTLWIWQSTELLALCKSQISESFVILQSKSMYVCVLGSLTWNRGLNFVHFGWNLDWNPQISKSRLKLQSPSEIDKPYSYVVQCESVYVVKSNFVIGNNLSL